MKEIKKSFKTLWFPFVKGKKKTYRIDVFKKNGTFEKMYLSGKVYAKGDYKLYKLNDSHLVTFMGKKYKDGKWTKFAESAIIQLSPTYQKYNRISVPHSSGSGMGKVITTSEYKDIMKRKSHSRKRTRRSHRRKRTRRSHRRKRSKSRARSRRRKRSR